MIYLDNAATTFPKPPQVAEAVGRYLTGVGATVNRSVYGPAREAERTVLSLREKLCRLLGLGDTARCILTPGATAGLNTVLRGWLRPGDHCLVSAMEHNAVMRPLRALEREGVTFTRVPCDGEGRLDPADIPPLVRPNTRLMVMAHGSNVCGVVQDGAEIARVCRSLGVPLVLDGAQTAGHVPIDVEGWGLAGLVVPGHKGLLGPSGTGAMLLAEDFARELRPLVTGGTGSVSHQEEQPETLPDKFEAGTPNLPGFYGLEAALTFILDRGLGALAAHEGELTARFLAGLEEIPEVRLAGPRDTRGRVGVISLDFLTMDNSEAAFFLERERGILTRCGLHCAPSAHRTLGTYPGGTVRFSLGWANTAEEVDAALAAIRELVREG